MKRQDRLESIQTVLLVYWYGADPSSSFGNIKPNEFVSYEEGMNQGLVEKAYQAALRKKESGAKLVKQELELIKGMEELMADNAVPQHERNRTKLDFDEEFLFFDNDEASNADVPRKKKGRPPKNRNLDARGEVIVDKDKSSTVDVPKRKVGRPPKKRNVEALGGEAIADKNDAFTVDVPKKKLGRPPKKRNLEALGEDGTGKPQKAKKARRNSLTASNESLPGPTLKGETLQPDSVEADPSKPERKKPGRKPGRKPKNLSDPILGVDGDGGADTDAVAPTEAMKGKEKSKSAGPVSTENQETETESLLGPASDNLPASPSRPLSTFANNVGEMEDIGDAEDDESLGSDLKDGNFATSDDDDAMDDDSLDEDFEGKKKGRKMSSAPSVKSKKEKPQKIIRATKGKKGKPKKFKEEKVVDPVVREKADYKRCCKDYLPLVERLEQAVVSLNFESVSTNLDHFLDASANFSAPFLEHHVVPIVKRTKQVIKESKRDDLLKVLKALSGKLTSIYEQKKPLVPAGFTLPKTRKSVAPVAPKPAPETTDSVGTTQAKQESADDADAVKATQPPAPNASTPDRKGVQELNSPISCKEQFAKDPAVIENAQPAAKAAPPQPAKAKTFSLGKLGQMIQRDQAQDATGANPARGSQSTPSWLLEPTAASSSVPGDENRSLAVEFLRDMAEQLPPDKVDVDAMALSLEKALYEWATSRTSSNGGSAVSNGGSGESKPGKAPWVAMYFDRLHAIVAAMSGKKDFSSTLANLVLSGAFATPMKLVELKEDDFAKSYNGQPIL
jgi:hypothetical protein